MLEEALGSEEESDDGKAAELEPKYGSSTAQSSHTKAVAQRGGDDKTDDAGLSGKSTFGPKTLRANPGEGEAGAAGIPAGLAPLGVM